MKISVIIPVYNVKEYLSDALRSVEIAARNVSSCLVQIVCVDDGSTDGSGLLLDNFNHARHGEEVEIKVIHQKNAGVSAARNRGLQESSGEWILFLDADDLLHPRIFEKLSEVIVKHSQLDAVRYEYEFIDDAVKQLENRLQDGSFSVDDLQKNAFGFFYGLYSVAFKKDLIGAKKFRMYSIGEDILFLSEVLSKAKTIGRLTSSLYGYRMRPGSAMQSAVTSRKIKDEIMACLRLLCLYSRPNCRMSTEQVRVFCNRYMEFLYASQFGLDSKERHSVNRCWRRGLRQLQAMPCVPRRQKLRICMVLKLPFAAQILCRFPYILKSKGFHRS